MQSILSFLTNRTTREWGAFFFFVSTAVLATVFISQSFGFHPCKLCYWQRWPYAVSGVLAVVLMALASKRNIAFVLFGLIALTFVVGGGIALFHLGVEYKWWEFHSDCAGNLIKPGASVEDFLARLKAAPTVKCDDRVPFLFGMTMAFYNVLTSAGLAVVALFALYSVRSNSLSQ